MSRPDPRNPIGPLLQAKVEIQDFSDDQLLELEDKLKTKVKNEKTVNIKNERVKAVFALISSEKKRRGL